MGNTSFIAVSTYTPRGCTCASLIVTGTSDCIATCRPSLREFLSAIKDFRNDLVVGAECMFTWYWLADLCLEEKIKFILGHALYMKAIHGGKKKDDKLDSEKIARLMRGGTFPLSYVYPREMRATRDLVRRRMFLVRRRSELWRTSS